MKNKNLEIPEEVTVKVRPSRKNLWADLIGFVTEEKKDIPEQDLPR